MKRIILCLSLFAFFGSQAQQINPVPDYVFRNQMSVGRNAVTDTAAYMSIGPRYGANKGLMPPIVSDTAAITGVKRNGLLIFSVQRNNFQYWDSINSRWTSVTANVDTTVISTRAWRKKGDDSLGAVIATRTDTTLLSTRAWRQKGLDSLAAIELNVADTATMLNPYTRGSGTVNYVPKFTTTRAFGNSQIFDNGTNVGIGTASPSSILHINGGTGLAHFRISEATTTRGFVGVANGIISGYTNELAIRAELGLILSGTGNAVSAYINSSGGEFIIANGNTDLGNYKLQVNGNMYTSGGGVMAASSGEILMGTTVDAGDFRLQVNGNANFRDDVLIDTNLRVNRHISLDQTPKAWALGNAIEGPQGSTLFVAGGGVQTLANIYYDGSYKYSTSNPGAAMFLLQSGITFATYGSGTANGALTGANEMVYAGGELRVGIADQGTFKLQVADKSYFGDEVQIASTTDLGNYKLQVTGEAIITAGIRTDAPTGGTAATWKLGSKIATSVQLDTANYIEVEVGGTFYRLALVTPL